MPKNKDDIDKTLDKAIKDLEKEGKVDTYLVKKKSKKKDIEIKEKEKEEEKPKIDYAVTYFKFIDFMKLYNFRDSYPTRTGNDLNDTKIIRIIYGDVFNQTYNAEKYHWFEFGIYDFGATRDLVESLNRIFSEEILNSYVYSYCVNEESGTFEIWLTKEPGDEYDD